MFPVNMKTERAGLFEVVLCHQAEEDCGPSYKYGSSYSETTVLNFEHLNKQTMLTVLEGTQR